MSKYDGQNIYNLFCEAREALCNSVYKWSDYGLELAAHEKKYRMAYTAETFQLHEDSHLKVAWTAAVEMAKGDETVAELRYLRDCAEVRYKAEEERICFLKIETRILENELKNIQYGK